MANDREVSNSGYLPMTLQLYGYTIDIDMTSLSKHKGEQRVQAIPQSSEHKISILFNRDANI